MRGEDNLSSLLLPRQKAGVFTKSDGKTSKFYSNIFEVKLKKDAMNLYQYSFDFSPEIPQDSDGLIEKITR